MKVKLKDAFDLQIGRTPARSNAANWNGQYKWISITDLGTAGKYISTTKEKITDKGIDESGIKIVPKGTVVMSFKLSIGKTAITTEDMYTNEAIVAFNVRESIQVDSSYLYYLCCGNDWGEGTNKAVMGLTLNKATLSEKEIELPEIMIQREVAKKLDKLDKIIIQRKKQLQKLDELIQARFVELFGNESNPKAWEIVNVESVADVQVGVVIKPSQYYTDAIDGIKAFRSLNVGEGFIKDENWVYFTKEGHKKNAKSVLKENDLLIVRSGAPGTACVVTKEYEGCNAIDIIIAHPNCEKVNPYYLCAYTNMPHGKKQINEGTGGAAQQHFNVTKYNKLQLMLPPMKLQDEFVTFVNQVNKSKLVIKNLLQIYKHQIQM
jgi:type I restriction enzyme S subunit